MKRTLLILAAAAAALLLGGCTPSLWTGTVTFEHHYDGGGLGGGGGVDEKTTYTVRPGDTLATVTTTYDSWAYDGDGFPNGTDCTRLDWHAERTSLGLIGVIGTNQLVAGLYKSSPELTPTPTFTGFDPETGTPFDCGTPPESEAWPALVATRPYSAPETLLHGSLTAGFEGTQDDCPLESTGETEHCYVTYDLHPYVR